MGKLGFSSQPKQTFELRLAQGLYVEFHGIPFLFPLIIQEDTQNKCVL